jgi:hypothetical protein
MNGEGIMALPQDMGMGMPQGGINELESLNQAQQVTKDLGVNTVSKELLSAGADVDPYEVKAFLDEIRAAGLTEEDKSALREVVDRVKADPDNYPQVRQELVKEGVPEDFLPEVFDPEFFIALELAVEADVAMAEQNAMVGSPVQGFAQGGIVELPQMKAVAAELARMGRNGDTMLAHITPQEATMLRRAGGSGTINPYTGLPEYFKKLFKQVKKTFNRVKKAVKKFAKSAVGRIVIGIAAGMLLGPAAIGFMQGATGIALSAAAQTALTVGVGSFASGMAAGDGFKNSLRAGVMAGAVAYGGSALFSGGASMATPDVATGPTSFSEGLSQGYGNITKAVNNMLGTQEGARAATPIDTVDTAAEMAKAGTPTAGTAAEQLGAEGVSATRPPDFMPARPDVPIDMTVGPGIESTSFTPPPLEPIPASAPAVQPIAQQQAAVQPIAPTSATQPIDMTVGPGIESMSAPPVERGFLGKTYDFFSPSARAQAGTLEAAQAADTARASYLASNPAASAAQADAVWQQAYKTAQPGIFTKYGPLAAAGLGATYLAGGMEGKPAEDPGLIQQGYTGEDYMRDNPGMFAGSLGTPQTYSYQSLVPTPGDFGRTAVSSPGTVVPTGITALPTARALVQEYNRSGMYGVPEIYRASNGSSPEGVTHFPRKTGPINGPGTGTSDSIPAMLSDGEFVFTAKAVRNMGNGSRRKGAARMYKMMKMLEGGPVGMASKKG